MRVGTVRRGRKYILDVEHEVFKIGRRVVLLVRVQAFRWGNERHTVRRLRRVYVIPFKYKALYDRLGHK